GEAVGGDRLGVALRALGQLAGLRPAGRAGVLEAGRAALVAVDGGGGRVEGQDLLPEAVGERADGGGRGVGGRHGNPPGGPRVGTLRSGYRGRAGQSSNSGICSPERSTSGSSPRNGSRSPSPVSSRSRNARAWFHFRMCQLSRSIASRTSGDRSILWRTSSGRPGASTRTRTSDSPCGIREPRLSSGSPSIAVHSTSNRNAARPRTYQTQSTSERSSTARLTPAR